MNSMNSSNAEPLKELPPFHPQCRVFTPIDIRTLARRSHAAGEYNLLRLTALVVHAAGGPKPLETFSLKVTERPSR